MTTNVMETVRKMMGWCPNAAFVNKKEEVYMVSYEGKYIEKIKGMGFRGILGALHLVFGVWLVITALSILARPQIFPWWILDINIISSGILLMIGLTSLLIFFNFLKSANIHRILALVNKDGRVKVLSWWDFELDIKAAGKEPVISYASEAIKLTIARPASMYDKFEPNEKVADVSRFFTTDSEDIAKSIAEKYGASLVYMPKERMRSIFSVMVMAGNPDINFQSLSGIGSSEVFDKRFYEPSMEYKFNSGAELKYFNKTFENKDVIIYQLK